MVQFLVKFTGTISNVDMREDGLFLFTLAILVIPTFLVIYGILVFLGIQVNPSNSSYSSYPSNHSQCSYPVHPCSF